MSSLNLALEQLYEAFAHYRLRLRSFCPHCWSEAEVAALRAVPPLRQRTWHVAPMLTAGVGTLGEVGDACHCLPRMVELSQRDRFRRSEVEQTVFKAPMSAAERAALEQYLKAEFLEQFEAGEAGDLLLNIARFGLVDELKPKVARIAPRWLAQLVVELGQRHWAAQGFSPAESVVVDWVLSERPAEALERAFFAAPTNNQALFSSAVQVLEWFG